MSKIIVLSPFGPRIASLKIPKNIIKKINIEVDRIIISKKDLKKTKNKNTKIINIKNFWVVRQFKNDYNPAHFHDGDISGVGYLMIPKNLNHGKKKIKTNGTIDFINGTKSFLNESIYNHLPKVGDFILFPNYLMHVAYPFTVEGERRSFSLNIKIDKKISNVFYD